MELLNIGFGNYISSEKIIAVVSPDSAPIRRSISESRKKGVLIDATQGRKTRAVIFTDSGQLILSGVQTESVANRMNRKNDSQ
ncbi:MAG: DUF370 domain-containing protein [Firmicutes bacterium]|nr:DUF370 domain-containing protein [Bacillota bacterium]